MAYFKAFKFDGKKTAQKAIDKIEDSSTSFIWMEEGDWAQISVNNRGHYRVHSTWAQDSRNVPGGFGLGAVLGGVIGLLFGPGGALAGAALGGSVGALMGTSANVTFEDPILEEFAASLIPDTSALVIFGDAETVAEFTGELADWDFVPFETELDEVAIEALKEDMTK